MTPSDLEKVTKLLSRRADLGYYLNSRINSHAHVTIYQNRSGPGNDRNYISIEIPLSDALNYLISNLKKIEEEIRSLGIEI